MSTEKKACQLAVTKMVSKTAVSPCTPTKNQFISSYFLRDKSNGEKKIILNLKKLNKFIKPPHFKIEDTKTVHRLIKRDDHMTTIDLIDSYFLIPVNKNFQKYLFSFTDQLFDFNALPFGLSTVPYVFIKVM